MRLPQSFKNAVAATAKSLNTTFKQAGALQREDIHHLPARNTVVHLGASLINAGYAVYAKPTNAQGVGQADLLACNQKLSFVISATTYRKLNLSKIGAQARQMVGFTPEAYPRLDQNDPLRFWRESERWGVLLMQSFSGEDLNELWSSQITGAQSFQKALAASTLINAPEKKAFAELAEFLQARQGYAGSEPICSELWANHTERLDLLWAAFTL